jgi:hypothetical protein
MSDFTQKHYISLMEAYASIYQQPDQVIEEQVEEEICFEDLEVDNDLMVDLVVERLIVEGYANTEDQALNMIPHMSDAWLDNVIGNFVLEESFIDAVNSLVEEGYNLSSYTVDELFEDYIRHFNNCLTEDYRMDLHEVVPLLAAPLLANPATWAAAAGLGAGALYTGKKAYDAYRQMKSGTSAEGEKWLQQGVLQAKTRKQQRDTSQERRQQASERLKSRQQATPQQPAPQAQPAKPAAGGAPPAGPTPPKPPKIDPLKTVKDVFKAGKEFVGKGKGPLSQVLGKPARERFFGTTRAGQITRGSTAAGVSALDIGGKIADPSKPSLVSKLGSVGPGAVGTVLQGAGNIPGIRGTSLGTGARGAGGAFRQVGREMRDQGMKPSSTSTGGNQGMTPIIKNGQIVGYK